MIILRKYFSKKDKGGGKKDKDNLKDGLVGMTLTGAGILGNKSLSNKMEKQLEIEPDAKKLEIYKKLKESAEKRGANVNDRTTLLNMTGPAYDSVNDVAYMNGKKHADYLSHELGHRHYNKEKAKTIGDKIGKAAHKLYKWTGSGRNPGLITPVVSLANGIHSGVIKAKKEAKGEKESKFNRHKTWAVPLALSAPVLISEGMASKHGIKLLKESGAGKEAIKEAKKRLGKAFGTYATGALSAVGLGELSRAVYGKNQAKIEHGKKVMNKGKDKKK